MERERTDRVSAGNPPYGLYLADNRNLSEVLGEEFDETDALVDSTVTSPPYADVKNYEADEDAQIGFGQSYDEYLESLREVYREVYDVTAEDGTLWVVVNTIKKDQRVVQLPFDIAEVCENLHGVSRCGECDDRLVKDKETGELRCDRCGWSHDPLEESWRLQDIVIWDKNRARPWSREGQFRNVFEYVLCFSKRARDFNFDLDSIRVPDTDEFKDWWVKYPERYNPRGKVPHNIWEYTTPTQGSWGDGEVDHPAPFPPELVERILDVSTDEGDVVLDPFAGTGSVLAQAEAMGRRPLGLEISPEYAQMYRDVRESRLNDWDGSSDEAKRDVLERTIAKLRQLKFPRELTRRVRKSMEVDTLDELGVNTIFQLSHEIVDREKFEEENLFMETDTVVVFDDDVDAESRERVTNAARECASRPPCSKFGIKPNVSGKRIGDVREYIEDFSPEGTLYLYDDDTYNEPSREIDVGEWEEMVRPERQWRAERAKNEYPPTISNVELSVPNPRNRDGTVSIDELDGEVKTDGSTATLRDF